MATSRPRQVSVDNMVYERIRDDLLSGHYEPGAKLRIEELTTKYQLGISPIREALSRLAEGGLIVYEAQRGYRVAKVSVEEYADLVSMRLMLEPAALRQSMQNGTLEWESNVVAAFHRLSTMQGRLSEGSVIAYRDWAREDRSFHLALIAACQSGWLLHFSRVVIEQIARYHRDRILSGLLPMHRTENEHKRLMDAALHRDVDHACQILVEHIQSVSARVSEAVSAR